MNAYRFETYLNGNPYGVLYFTNLKKGCEHYKLDNAAYHRISRQIRRVGFCETDLPEEAKKANIVKILIL